ncbi:MAG: type III pantothenate kinase [Bacteroidetes bacterium]|nr:type III pantothenate kinase [Bacteroidota bacterium]
MMDHVDTDLVLDVGNTRIKLALFAEGRIVARDTARHGDAAAVAAFLGPVRPRAVVVGSVAERDEALLAFLRTLGPVTEITGASPAPLRNAYGTPATLGVDRLADAVGAMQLFPGRAALAIDLGTCVTYDLVDGAGAYHGGAITPGLRMRARAMHAYSARLPDVDPPEDAALLGTDTVGSLAAGTHHGLRLELEGFIGAFRQQWPDLAVVLTGGDAPRFARALKNGIFAHPSLTLLGLHALFLHDPDRGAAAAR